MHDFCYGLLKCSNEGENGLVKEYSMVKENSMVRGNGLVKGDDQVKGNGLVKRKTGWCRGK